MFRGPSFRKSFQWLCWKSCFRNHHGKRHSPVCLFSGFRRRHPPTPFSSCTELFWKPKFQKISLNNLKKVWKTRDFPRGWDEKGQVAAFPSSVIGIFSWQSWAQSTMATISSVEKWEKRWVPPVRWNYINQYCLWKIGGIWMKISFILLLWSWCDCIAIIMLLASRTKEWYHVAMHVDGWD